MKNHILLSTVLEKLMFQIPPCVDVLIFFALKFTNLTGTNLKFKKSGSNAAHCGVRQVILQALCLVIKFRLHTSNSTSANHLQIKST